MSPLKTAEIKDPTKLQLALQDMLFEDVPSTLNEVYTDGEYLYGHVLDGEILLWKIKQEGDEYQDLQFVLLPQSELAERTVLDMLEEARGDKAWD